MVTGSRRRDGFLDKPWVAIALAAGVLIVVICAVVFFMGGCGNSTGITSPASATSPSSPGLGAPAHAAGSSTGLPGVLAYNVAMTSGYELDHVAVPDKGTFIKVICRGGYEGKYTSGNGTQELRNSGERVFEIEKPGTTVSATVKKQDGSTKQALTVEIWKNGTRLVTKTTALPYGEVTVSSAI
ncbi:MAG: hypothetical protein WC620_07455 [Methanoregula sp.]